MARILYHYDPSKTAAIAAAALFTLTLVIHIFQLFKKKTWYFTAFVIGVACQFFSSSLLHITSPSHNLSP